VTVDDRMHIEAGFASSVQFRVSEQMVAHFAALTGDRSALHVNESFARRSSYRQPVVHGMLPVAFLCLVEGLRLDGMVAIPVSISGRFTNPVHPGDQLELHVARRRTSGSIGDSEFEYWIEQITSGAIVTKGAIGLRYRPARAGQGASDAPQYRDSCLLRTLPTVLNLRPQDVSGGRSDGFEFEVTGEAMESFLALLEEGAGRRGSTMNVIGRGDFQYANLLAVNLISTLVGTRLPGDSATFLEFAVEFAAEVEVDTAFRLEGAVRHFSRATNVMKADVSVRAVRNPANDVTMGGKLAALLNPAPRSMPSIREIKALAMESGLRGKVALVTGASRGIGETTAKLLALHGARVVVNYHRGGEDASRIVKEIEAEGGSAIAVQADVTSLEQVRNMVGRVKETYGAIHVLVNNAVRNYKPIPFLSLGWDEVQKDLDVIAKGTFHCCKEVVPLMLAAGGGKIINISSVAVENPPSDQAKYVTAKSALVGLTRSLAADFASKNIQVNLVVPSFVETDLISHVQEGFRKRIAQDNPMGRHATPIEVAQAIVFLASSHASFTTGQKIMVTGGGVPFL